MKTILKTVQFLKNQYNLNVNYIISNKIEKETIYGIYRTLLNL